MRLAQHRQSDANEGEGKPEQESDDEAGSETREHVEVCENKCAKGPENA